MRADSAVQPCGDGAGIALDRIEKQLFGSEILEASEAVKLI